MKVSAVDYLGLKKCPICDGSMMAKTQALHDAKLVPANQFSCGLVLSSIGMVKSCPLSAKYAWRKAIVEMQILSHGETDEILAADLFKRAEEELALVASDRHTLILGAAQSLWRRFMVDGIINKLHHPTECPTLFRHEQWGRFPCEHCHPAMAAQWGDLIVPVKQVFLAEAEEGPHLEWEMAITINMLMNMIIGGGARGK